MSGASWGTTFRRVILPLLKPGLLGKLGVLDKAKMRKQAYESFTSMGTDVKDVDAAAKVLAFERDGLRDIAKAYEDRELGAVVRNQVGAIVGVLVFTQFLEPVGRAAAAFVEGLSDITRFLPGGFLDRTFVAPGFGFYSASLAYRF